MAKSVSLSSKWDSRGALSVDREARNWTVVSVEAMSGILERRPASRRCVFTSMNWYFLKHLLVSRLCWGEPFVYVCVTRRSCRCSGRDETGGLERGKKIVSVRYHLLEALECALNFLSVGDIVFYPVDEWRDGNTARIGGRRFFPVKELVRYPAYSPCKTFVPLRDFCHCVLLQQCISIL